MLWAKKKLELLLIALITSWTLCVLANEILASVHPFAGTFCNGTFQILNPLRRIAEGQIMGKDFFFFHGVLIPYTIYPFYKLFGADLYASELARQLIPFILFLIINACLLFSITKNRLQGLIAFLVLLLVSTPMMYRGEHSLLSLRSLPPLLLIASYCYKDSYLIYLLRGALLSWVVFNSTEQGLAFCIALVMFYLVKVIKYFASDFKWQECFSKVLAPIIGLFSFALFSWLILLILKIDLQSFKNILEFNYNTVPSEQFWYYGSPPASFFFRWLDLFTMPVGQTMIMIIVTCIGLIGLFTYLYFQKTTTQTEMFLLQPGLLLLFYGLLSTSSCLGIASRAYLYVAERSIFFCCLCLTILYINKQNPTLNTWLSAINNFIVIIKHQYQKLSFKKSYTLMLSCIILFGLLRTYKIIYLLTDKPSLNDDTKRAHKVNWARWDRLVKESILTEQPLSIWSTYASLAEYESNSFNPHTDYIIHALGNEQRDEYLETFKTSAPEFVQTFKRGYTPWEEWLEVTTWGFWDHLIDHYEPYKFIEHSIFWRRTTQPKTRRSAWIKVNSKYNPKHFIIEHKKQKDSYGLYILKFKYKITEKYKIPYFNRLNKFFVSIFNSNNSYSISLSPYRSDALLPIYVKNLPDKVSSFNQSSKLQKIEVQIADIGLFSNLTNIEIYDPEYQWVEMPFNVYEAFIKYKRQTSNKKMLLHKVLHKISRKKIQFYDFIIERQEKTRRYHKVSSPEDNV